MPVLPASGGSNGNNGTHVDDERHLHGELVEFWLIGILVSFWILD
jgi:hypothetical protein